MAFFLREKYIFKAFCILQKMLFWALYWHQGACFHFHHNNSDNSDNHFMSSNNSWPECFVSIQIFFKSEYRTMIFIDFSLIFVIFLTFQHFSSSHSHLSILNFGERKSGTFTVMDVRRWLSENQYIRVAPGELCKFFWASSSINKSQNNPDFWRLCFYTPWFHKFQAQTYCSALTADCSLNFGVLSTIKENCWLCNFKPLCGNV